MKKITTILVSLILVAFGTSSYVLASDTTVTGTFTAQGDLDVDVNDSSAAFGAISVGEFGVQYLSVTNNGNVTADVTQDQASYDSGSMSIGTNGSLNQDEYSVLMWNETGSWNDVGSAGDVSIANGLEKDATQNYTLYVWVASTLGATEYADETFSADLTVAADT